MKFVGISEIYVSYQVQIFCKMGHFEKLDKANLSCSYMQSRRRVASIVAKIKLHLQLFVQISNTRFRLKASSR
jgi:hypothetical protein